MFYNTTPGNRRGERKETESTVRILRKWWGRLMDFLLCICIVIITVILPFYFKEGYGYIATDKNLFFRKAALVMGKILVPVVTVDLFLTAAVRFGEKRQTGSGQGKRKKVLSPTDFFAVLYGAALVISYCCSDYREHALWGSESWYMGFFTQIVLLCLYFLIAKRWKPRAAYFYLMLAVSAAVFVLGYLNRFSIYPIKMEMSNPGFISTIGNINWYCGYAVTVFFAGAAFFWQGGGKRGRKSILQALYVWLGFAALVTQGSASGIMTLAAVMFLLFVLSAGEGERMCRFWMTAFLLGTGCLFTQLLMLAAPDRMNFQDEIMNLLVTGIVPAAMTIVSFFFWMWVRTAVKTPVNPGRRKGGSVQGYPGKQLRRAAGIFTAIAAAAFLVFVILIIVNTVHPGSIGKMSEYGIFTFSDTWGSKRGATWKAGIRCFSEQNLLHKFTGVGPDAMEAFIYGDGSQELVEALRAVFGYNALTNAHNEWLTILVNTGILGITGFAGMMVSAIAGFLKKIGKNPAAGACGVALFAYTVNNIFSFQQIMNITQMYVIMGMGMAFLREDAGREEDSLDGLQVGGVK